MSSFEKRTILGDKEVDTLADLESLQDDEAVIGAIMGKLLSNHAVLAPESDRMKLLLVKAQAEYTKATRDRAATVLR